MAVIFRLTADRRTPGKPRRIDYFPDEFLVGTTDLTLEEAGAYWKVCSLIYSRGGPVDDDDRWIAKAIAADVRKWKPIRARLLTKGKLIRADGKLSNARCETELAKVRRRIEDAHTNGALGGRPPRQSPEDVGKMSTRSPGKLIGAAVEALIEGRSFRDGLRRPPAEAISQVGSPAFAGWR